MSRIPDAFVDGPAFIGFVTAGDPDLASSEQFVLAMAEAGANLIEIGVPFSDPIAEGPVIQEANLRALAANTTMDEVLELVARVRLSSEIPLVLLTYLNPVFHYGYGEFFTQAAKVGVDGIIIPDLPFEEHGELRDIAAAADVDLISMIAPTSEGRVAEVCALARGFIYLVSSMGVTGVRSELGSGLPDMVARVRQHTMLPIAVGFGISTPEQAASIAQYADAVIVGSRIVTIIAEHGSEATPHLKDYVSSMKAAMSTPDTIL